MAGDCCFLFLLVTVGAAQPHFGRSSIQITVAASYAGDDRAIIYSSCAARGGWLARCSCWRAAAAKRMGRIYDSS